MEARASSMGLVDGSSCRTVRTRCMRLNSSPVMPSTEASLLRMRASSMGQSMFLMRYTAVVSEARAARAPSTGCGASCS